MKLTILIAVILLLFVVSDVHAISYSNLNITSNISQSYYNKSEISVYNYIQIFNYKSSIFNFTIPDKATNITIYKNGIKSNFSINKVATFYILNIPINKQNESISIRYIITNYYINQPNNFTYVTYLVPPTLIRHLYIIDNLPIGAYIQNETSDTYPYHSNKKRR